jgi:hypothetical protein
MLSGNWHNGSSWGKQLGESCCQGEGGREEERKERREEDRDKFQLTPTTLLMVFS